MPPPRPIPCNTEKKAVDAAQDKVARLSTNPKDPKTATKLLPAALQAVAAAQEKLATCEKKEEIKEKQRVAKLSTQQLVKELDNPPETYEQCVERKKTEKLLEELGAPPKDY